jgi:protein TonB
MTLSLVAATAVHGALFGVAAVVLSLSHGAVPAVVPTPVEIEVVAARPDPIADTSRAAATAAPSRSPEPAPARPRVVRHPREVALAVDPALPSPPSPLSASTESAPVVDGPPVAAATPSVSPSSVAVAVSGRGAAPAAQSGGGAVSAKPRYRSNPTPDYPIPSKRRREEGIVLLNVQVQIDGTPAAVSLNRSCGHPLLDRAAVDAVRRWTFEPARAAGVPVASLVVVPVRFSLADQP